jgi:hypothetical protein
MTNKSSPNVDGVVFPLSVDAISNPAFVNGVPGYVIRDQFTTDRAAGSVNATDSEPGPGLRTVVDTNNKLSISDNAVQFASGGVGYGNPGITIPTAITRSPGIILVGTLNVSTFSNTRLVWCTSNSSGNYTNWNHAIGLQTATTYLNIYENAGLNLLVGTGVLSTKYNLAIILRSTGAFYFIKGGTYSNWTLLYISPSNNTATLYAWITHYSSGVGKSTYLAIPNYKWTPTPLAYATFADAWGTTEGYAGDGGYGAGGGGLTWVSQPGAGSASAGTWQTSGGKANASALDTGVALTTVDIGSADVYVQCDLVRAGGGVGNVIRYIDTNNYMYTIHDGTKFALNQRLAGSDSEVMSATATYGDNRVGELHIQGNTARLYYNNVLTGTHATNAAFVSATKHGLYTSNTGNTFDNFKVWPLTSGETILNTFEDIKYVTFASGQWFNSTNLLADDKLYIMVSNDGLAWTFFKSYPVYTAASPDTRVRDVDVMCKDGLYYAVFNNAVHNGNITIIKSTDLINWTVVCRPDFTSVGVGSYCWAPRWFKDDDGSWHIFVASSPDTSHFQIYEINPTATDFSTWSTPTVVTGTSLGANIIDPFVVSRANSPTGNYSIWYCNKSNNDYVELMESTSLTSGYTKTKASNWASWGTNHEGPTLVKYSGTTWRIYWTTEATGEWNYTESTDWTSWSAPTALPDLLTQQCQFGHFKLISNPENFQ